MKKQKLSLFFILVTLAAVLCGCSDGKQEKGPDESIPPAESGTAEEPVYGGSVVVGIQQDIDSLDPHKAVAAGTKEILFNIYEGLVKPDKDGNLVPAIAESYTVAPDGKSCTFVLRDNVTFHNGNPVTAEDVVYSIKRCAGLLKNAEPTVVVEKALSHIIEVNTPDEKTVEVVLDEPNTEIAGYLTCAVIPSDSKDLEKNPVGTGPFKFQSYTPLESLIVVNNDAYYGQKAYLDEVTFKMVANTDAAFMDLQSGSIDIYAYLTSDQAAQLEGTFRIEKGTLNLVQGIFLNNKSELFSDKRVRQALNYAVDRQGILDMVGNGDGHILESDMFPGFGIYYSKEAEMTYERDVEKAKELLREAGYPEGISFTMIVPSNFQYHVSTAQVAVEQLKEAGIHVTLKTVEETTWLSDVYTDRNYDATLYGLAAKVVVPGRVMERYASEASNNFINYSNPEYDKVLEKALKATDQQEKIDCYKELQQMLADDAASVYLQDPAHLIAVNPKLKGYTFYPVFVQDMSTIYYTAE